MDNSTLASVLTYPAALATWSRISVWRESMAANAPFSLEGIMAEASLCELRPNCCINSICCCNNCTIASELLVSTLPDGVFRASKKIWSQNISARKPLLPAYRPRNSLTFSNSCLIISIYNISFNLSSLILFSIKFNSFLNYFIIISKQSVPFAFSVVWALSPHTTRFA